MTLLDDIQAYARENDAALLERISRRGVKRDVDRIEKELSGLDGDIVQADAIAAEKTQALHARQLQLDQELEAAKAEVRRLETEHYQKSAKIRGETLKVYQLAQAPRNRQKSLESELVKVLQVNNDRGNFLELVQECAERRAAESEKDETLQRMETDYPRVLELLGLRR